MIFVVILPNILIRLGVPEKDNGFEEILNNPAQIGQHRIFNDRVQSLKCDKVVQRRSIAGCWICIL